MPSQPRVLPAAMLLAAALCAGLLGSPVAARAQAPLPPSGAIPAAPLGSPLGGADVIALIRADRWGDAQQAVTGAADPVAGKLVTYYRLLAPYAANASEIDAFMAQNPDWPNQAGLARRREDALAVEPDDATAAALCATTHPRAAATLLRCADALSNTGKAGPATDAARAAWTSDGIADAQAEQRFIARWGSAVTAAEQWQRFLRLPNANTGALLRQQQRLDPAHALAATAIIALRHDDPQAETMAAALPPAMQADPAVVLEWARHLRRTDQDAAALALWRQRGAAAQKAAAGALTPFWTERNILARALLKDNDSQGAYDIAAAHGQTEPEAVADAEFLAGWIALRKLNKPADAIPHFRRLAEVSRAAITQGRAWYWLGRAETAAGNAAAAKRDFSESATWVTTYYGQLAALALGDDAAALYARVRARRDPGFEPGQALDFAGREVARAAALLVAWGDPRRARPFLLRLQDLAPDPADRTLAARFAAGLGLPDQAVFIARRAGLFGHMLREAGWPRPFTPPAGPLAPAVAPAFALGIMRQESSFDAQVVSPAGARGLMQLMPATARQVARASGVSEDTAALTADPALNMTLGTAYLQGLMDQFGGAMPMAIAAYNAGPNRVNQWLAQNTDPRSPGGNDMIDWIELIPFNETRNYVQRVIENVVVYRAELNDTAPHPLAQWLGGGGLG